MECGGAVRSTLYQRWCPVYDIQVIADNLWTIVDSTLSVADRLAGIPSLWSLLKSYKWLR